MIQKTYFPIWKPRTHHLITTINKQKGTRLLGEGKKLGCLGPEKPCQQAPLALATLGGSQGTQSSSEGRPLPQGRRRGPRAGRMRGSGRRRPPGSSRTEGRGEATPTRAGSPPGQPALPGGRPASANVTAGEVTPSPASGPCTPRPREPNRPPRPLSCRPSKQQQAGAQYLGGGPQRRPGRAAPQGGGGQQPAGEHGGRHF